MKDSQTSCQYLKKENYRLEHDRNMLKVDKDNEIAEIKAELDQTMKQAQQEKEDKIEESRLRQKERVRVEILEQEIGEWQSERDGLLEELDREKARSN